MPLVIRVEQFRGRSGAVSLPAAGTPEPTESASDRYMNNSIPCILDHVGKLAGGDMAGCDDNSDSGEECSEIRCCDTDSNAASCDDTDAT